MEGDDKKINDNTVNNIEKINRINGLINDLQNEIKSLDAEGETIAVAILKNIDQIKIKKISQFIDKIPG